MDPNNQAVLIDSRTLQVDCHVYVHHPVTIFLLSDDHGFRRIFAVDASVRSDGRLVLAGDRVSSKSM
ncbi:hypothetical protein QJS10_CPA01g02009 [Acorus calamus]|uniref:Uncharacterized protein n=1 Tax=Acorus calamus TaxID=4465 RepID=A0AAV9FVI4_ACOCL|nr:hypothetical protein QJS10_CPA01g02009 [Acorus calamus]